MRLRSVWMLLLLAASGAWHSMPLAATSVLQVPAHKVAIHDTQEEVMKACGTDFPINGCMNRVTMTMHVLKVRSWCDTVRLETVGHEYMHLIGYHHDNFETPRVTSVGCANGEFVKP